MTRPRTSGAASCGGRARHQGADRRARHQELAGDVDGGRAAGGLARAVGQPRAGCDGGVVRQHVVAVGRQQLTRRRGALARARRDIGEHRQRAFGGEAARDRPPDPRGASADERPAPGRSSGHAQAPPC
jgi:hypothetical protein